MSFYWKCTLTGIFIITIGAALIDNTRLFWGVGLLCIGNALLDKRKKYK